MKWILNGEMMLHPPTGKIGFVYLIIEKETGMKYVGQKLFYKGEIYQSDWRTYNTSSNVLKPKIIANPKGYEYIVLDLAVTKKQLTFLERKWINEHLTLNCNYGYNRY